MGPASTSGRYHEARLLIRLSRQAQISHGEAGLVAVRFFECSCSHDSPTISSVVPTTRAGAPTAIEQSGILPLTTLFAPMMQ